MSLATMLRVPTVVKKFISRFTDRPIELGTGVSSDDEFSISESVTDKRIEQAVAASKCIYKLHSTTGSFELVGTVGNSTRVHYQLKHILTGETFNVSKKMFTLLFEKESKNE